ncbi:MAG: thioredoxin domain-containing protein [Bacteroidota bacterium]|nr:thioredoxin domain-containing protein [Bacteroidota bacterium]
MANKLEHEKSPYLLQHANNPVEWFPWGDEAFQKAKKEDKPIFLSIGYSTCHWCHVMERESFENKEITSLMNKYFVNIKVDREERPDVDKVYMNAVQMMAGSGGWPLSVFLTPDLKPFYGGTYFPPKDGYGRPGFPTLLERIHEVWLNEKENVLHSGNELINALQHSHPVDTKDSHIDDVILKRTYHQIAAGYDPKFSGFGNGPKFPRPVVLNFLFRYYHRTKENEALSMALTTLMAMASGGMYDHLGGGFHRYSVDAQWRVPHFEKMLYDQAQLVDSYLDAFQITHDNFFAQVAIETLDYVLRDMRSPEGGFYSAEDADSADAETSLHKIEGAFYVWTKSEIEKHLTPQEAKVFCHFYGVEESGNALSDPQHEFNGKNILYSPFTMEQTAQHLSISIEEAVQLLNSAKEKLFKLRNQRPRPSCDDKILAGWNGLMIGALARASNILQRKDYAAAASTAAEFILKKLYRSEEKKLFRRYRDGETKYEAHLDDYAFVVSGLLELYEASGELRWIQFAIELTNTMISLFWDSAEGGFYDTAGKDSSVLVRMKEAYDGAEPAGNSIAVMNLIRLYQLTNNSLFKEYAEKTLRYFSSMLLQSPQVMPLLMCAVDLFLSPPEHVILVTGTNKESVDRFRAAIARHYLPNLTTVLLNEHTHSFVEEHLPFTKQMKMIHGKTTLFYCKNYSCNLPTTSLEDFGQQLLEE